MKTRHIADRPHEHRRKLWECAATTSSWQTVEGNQRQFAPRFANMWKLTQVYLHHCFTLSSFARKEDDDNHTASWSKLKVVVVDDTFDEEPAVCCCAMRLQGTLPLDAMQCTTGHIKLLTAIIMELKLQETTWLFAGDVIQVMGCNSLFSSHGAPAPTAWSTQFNRHLRLPHRPPSFPEHVIKPRIT